MKNPEEVARIELMARIETALTMAQAAIELAPYAHAVPIDHPLAHAMSEARLAILKAQALARSTLTRFKR